MPGRATVTPLTPEGGLGRAGRQAAASAARDLTMTDAPGRGGAALGQEFDHAGPKAGAGRHSSGVFRDHLGMFAADLPLNV